MHHERKPVGSRFKSGKLHLKWQIPMDMPFYFYKENFMENVFDKAKEFLGWLDEVDLMLNSCPKIEVTKEIIETKDSSFAKIIPNKPGIYEIWADEEIKYIGKHQNIRRRVKEHSIYDSPGSPDSKRDEVLDALRNHHVYFAYAQVEPEEVRAALESGLQTRYDPPWCERRD